MDYSMPSILADIQRLKSKGYLDKISRHYKRFPQTSCDCCGQCCNVSPLVSYPEFLYLFNHFNDGAKFSKESKTQVYRKALEEHFYGFISTQRRCPFLSEDNKCQIHQAAPLVCKRWGTQSKEAYDCLWEKDLSSNQEVQDFYATKGVNIPEEVISYRLPYCKKVRVVKNPYNFVINDIEKAAADIEKMLPLFGKKGHGNFSIGNYLVLAALGEKAFEDRISVLKAYQSGDNQAIENYIHSSSLDTVVI